MPRPSGGRLTPRQRGARVLLLSRLDHVLGQARREADGARGLLARFHVRGRDVDDAVGIDLERDLDAHFAAVADAKPGELELPEHLALGRLVRLALVDADLDLLLPVAVRGGGLAALDGNGRVLAAEFVGVAAERPDAPVQ